MRIYNQHFDKKQLHFVLKVGSRPKYWIKLGVWKIIIYDLDIKFINKQEARSIVSLIKKLKSLGNLDISFEGHAIIVMLYVIVDLDIYIFPLSLISTLNLWCSDITGIWVWGQLAQLILTKINLVYVWYVLYYRFYRFGWTLSHTSLHEQTILELDTKQKKIIVSTSSC